MKASQLATSHIWDMVATETYDALTFVSEAYGSLKLTINDEATEITAFRWSAEDSKMVPGWTVAVNDRSRSRIMLALDMITELD